MSPKDTKPQEYLDVLFKSVLFHGMAKEAIEDLLKSGVVKDFKTGVNAIEENLIRMPGLNVILEGKVEIWKHQKEKISEIETGSFFGEISLFGMSLSPSATAVVLEKCKVLLITRDVLEKWFERFPYTEAPFFRYLSTELCNRLYSTTEKLVHS